MDRRKGHSRRVRSAAMTIRYSPSARDELRQLKAYLTAQFGAVVAAKSAAKIISDISPLKQHRLLAGDLSDKVGRETPYLYLLCGKYSIAILSNNKEETTNAAGDHTFPGCVLLLVRNIRNTSFSFRGFALRQSLDGRRCRSVHPPTQE